MDYRQKIIEEASIMFRTYGIRAVTMDMLAGRMGISKRTIYEVFNDKDEILQGVLGWMVSRQRDLMTKILGESQNVIEAVFKMLDAMSNHYQKMSPAFRMDIKKYHGDIVKNLTDQRELPYYTDNAEILNRGIKEGVFREDLDIGITNNVCFEMLRMTEDDTVFLLMISRIKM
jgi:AcrR family transcriptional regulator